MYEIMLLMHGDNLKLTKKVARILKSNLNSSLRVLPRDVVELCPEGSIKGSGRSFVLKDFSYQINSTERNIFSRKVEEWQLSPLKILETYYLYAVLHKPIEKK